MCSDPQHGAYKIKAVKWFWFAVLGLVLAFCPECWSERLSHLVAS